MHDEARVTDKAVHREPIRGVRTLQTCWFSAKEWDVSDGGRYCGACFKSNHRWIRRFIRQLRWAPHVSSARVIKRRCLSAPGYMGMSPGQAQAVKTGDIWAFSSFTETSSVVMKLKGHGFDQKHSYFILHEHLWATLDWGWIFKDFFYINTTMLHKNLIYYLLHLKLVSVCWTCHVIQPPFEKHVINICALRCLATYWHIHRYRLIWDKCQPVWLIGRVLR